MAGVRPSVPANDWQVQRDGTLIEHTKSRPPIGRNRLTEQPGQRIDASCLANADNGAAGDNFLAPELRASTCVFFCSLRR
jgi:hypothetical protein